MAQGNSQIEPVISPVSREAWAEEQQGYAAEAEGRAEEREGRMMQWISGGAFPLPLPPGSIEQAELAAILDEVSAALQQLAQIRQQLDQVALLEERIGLLAARLLEQAEEEVVDDDGAAANRAKETKESKPKSTK